MVVMVIKGKVVVFKVIVILDHKSDAESVTFS